VLSVLNCTVEQQSPCKEHSSNQYLTVWLLKNHRYTAFHKKRGSLFLTVTLDNLNRF